MLILLLVAKLAVPAPFTFRITVPAVERSVVARPVKQEQRRTWIKVEYGDLTPVLSDEPGVRVTRAMIDKLPF